MYIACLDLEGVLLPEIWINVADKTGIEELKLTTRDISDYDKLMQHRLKILRGNNIKIIDIKNVINTLQPLEGANDFLNKLKEKYQVIILSDTFYQFADPLMRQLDYPALFCHDLVIDEIGYIVDYKLRMKDSKRESVKKIQELNFKVIATGDSYNDITMLNSANKGILFRPPQNVIDEFSQFPVANDYSELLRAFQAAEEELDRG